MTRDGKEINKFDTRAADQIGLTNTRPFRVRVHEQWLGNAFFDSNSGGANDGGGGVYHFVATSKSSIKRCG